MANLVEEINVSQPVDKVFAFLANPENRVVMYVNVVEVVKLTAGDTTVGSKFREIRQLTNRKVGSVLEITELEQEKRVGMLSDSNGIKVLYRYFCKETAQGTNIRFEGTVITDSLRTKLMRPVLVKMLKNEDADHLLNVKKELEK
ncbi:Polyketide cyclase / dehydrase and lipid transport [Evansella caseinilytica]|uniref:Polyketide cyclase / dehydrase and lipid transport n=1 Tax=Evansella caseinilytica TaxID=1503961 RepID=A0A1H3LUD9_9BACI|nr:Polyketide cyclase / dehydrase and lipid transport [Evansella caseinilytica]